MKEKNYILAKADAILSALFLRAFRVKVKHNSKIFITS